MSSRLFQSIREEMGLAYSVYSFHCFFASAGHVGAYVGARPEVADQARDVLLSELGALARDGLRADELEDTRTQLKGQIVISLESPATRMNRLAGVALFDQPFRTVDEVAARIDAVDAEQCARAAGLFDPERSAVIVLSPETGTVPAAEFAHEQDA
jgi:predicted Zn-dependent peptidase